MVRKWIFSPQEKVYHQKKFTDLAKFLLIPDILAQVLLNTNVFGLNFTEA